MGVPRAGLSSADEKLTEREIVLPETGNDLMRYPLIALAILLSLCGCAISTGILPAGPDTYTVTEHVAPIRGGSSEAERVAMAETNQFCAQQGRVFVPVMMGAVPSMLDARVTNGYAVTFRCLPPGTAPR